MTSKNRPTRPHDDGVAAPAAAAKKPYQKPAFVREQVFETMALACGKINSTSGACKVVKKNS
jgi:hypothetical protein